MVAKPSSAVWLAAIIVPPVIFILFIVYSIVYYRKVRKLVGRAATDPRRSRIERRDEEGLSAGRRRDSPDLAPPPRPPLPLAMEERRASRIPVSLIIRPSPLLPIPYSQFPDPPRSAPLPVPPRSPATTISRRGSRVLSKRRRPLSMGSKNALGLPTESARKRDKRPVVNDSGERRSDERSERSEEMEEQGIGRAYSIDMRSRDEEELRRPVTQPSSPSLGLYTHDNVHIRRRSATWADWETGQPEQHPQRPPLRPDLDRLGVDSTFGRSDDSCGTNIGAWGSHESGVSTRGLLSSTGGGEEQYTMHTAVPISLERTLSSWSQRPALTLSPIPLPPTAETTETFDSPYVVPTARTSPQRPSPPRTSPQSTPPATSTPLPTTPRRFTRASLVGLLKKPEPQSLRYSSADLYSLEGHSPSSDNSHAQSTVVGPSPLLQARQNSSRSLPPLLSVRVPDENQDFDHRRSQSLGHSRHSQQHSPGATSVMSVHTFGDRNSANLTDTRIPDLPMTNVSDVAEDEEEDESEDERSDQEDEMDDETGEVQFAVVRSSGVRWLPRLDSTGTLPSRDQQQDLTLTNPDEPSLRTSTSSITSSHRRPSIS